MNEIWKNIEGYPNYMVSNMGRVKSLNYNRTGEEKIMKGIKNNRGYLYVQLYKEGKQKNYLIHRLVASAFIPNPGNLSEINHINEDKTNNQFTNLEWCNRIYNLNYGTHNERMAKSKYKPVLQFSKTDEFIKKWDSVSEASRVLGINQGDISSCLKGKYKSAGNYVWIYANEVA